MDIVNNIFSFMDIVNNIFTDSINIMHNIYAIRMILCIILILSMKILLTICVWQFQTNQSIISYFYHIIYLFYNTFLAGS
jgi:hypothetical protein